MRSVTSVTTVPPASSAAPSRPTSRGLHGAVVAALLWASSLLTFATAHAAASCSFEPAAMFATAGVALVVGAAGAGVLSDRIGRATTARILFVFGSLAAAAAVAAHPDDAGILLVLAAAAGAAAGGSHVAAELVAELMPEPQKRAVALLCYPALFFPVGLVQAGIEWAGWAPALVATAVVTVLAGAGLASLPESAAFLAHKAASLQRRAAERAAALEREQETGVPAEYDIRGRITGGGNSGGSDSSSCGCLRQLLRRRPGAVCCNRGTAVLACIWVFFTAAYYLSSLTLFVVPAEEAEAAAAAARGGATGGLCGAKSAHEGAGAGGPSDPASPPASSSSSSSCASVGVFHSGAHLVAAELLALLTVAVLMRWRRIGARLTLSLSFAAAAAATGVAAVASPAFGCEGSLTRACVEFFLRLAMAACAQSLFVYTVGAASTASRGTVSGACVALFRAGALVTLAQGLTPGEDARLQWSLYALSYEAGLFGLSAETAAHATAVTALLAACAQVCIVCACMTACLPVEVTTPAAEGEGASDKAAVEGEGGFVARTLAAALRRVGAGGGANSRVSGATYGMLSTEETEEDGDGEGSEDGDIVELELPGRRGGSAPTAVEAVRAARGIQSAADAAGTAGPALSGDALPAPTTSSSSSSSSSSTLLARIFRTQPGTKERERRRHAAHANRARTRTASLVDAADGLHGDGDAAALTARLAAVTQARDGEAAATLAERLERLAAATATASQDTDDDGTNLSPAALREEAARLRVLARVWKGKGGLQPSAPTTHSLENHGAALAGCTPALSPVLPATIALPPMTTSSRGKGGTA
jgi:hypothetical protein